MDFFRCYDNYDEEVIKRISDIDNIREFKDTDGKGGNYGLVFEMLQEEEVIYKKWFKTARAREDFLKLLEVES